MAAKLGFPPDPYSYKYKYSFFADLCVDIWENCVKNGVRTFDTEIKKAQLYKLQIPCSVLLVDESQDLDEAQVGWIECQREFGKTMISSQIICYKCSYMSSTASIIFVILDRDTHLFRWRLGPMHLWISESKIYLCNEAGLSRYETHAVVEVWPTNRSNGQHIIVCEREISPNYHEFRQQAHVDSVSCARIVRESQG